MSLLKIPPMSREEYDRLIREQFIGRIAFGGEGSPYIAPFLYVFDGAFLYFLSTRYGKKIDYFSRSPEVSVEVDHYTPDMSHYRFVTLAGRLEEVRDARDSRAIRIRFLELFDRKKLSRNALAALGHSPDEPVEAILSDRNTAVWKLIGVRGIVGLKSPR